MTTIHHGHPRLWMLLAFVAILAPQEVWSEEILLDNRFDTAIGSYYPDYDYAQRSSVGLSETPGRRFSVLLRFPEAVGGEAIPAGATIRSATLLLSFEGVTGEGGSGVLYPLQRAWRAGEDSEGGTTWRHAVAPTIPWAARGAADPLRDHAPEIEDAHPIPQGSPEIAWDVTASVQGWVSGVLPNHGWILLPRDGARLDPYAGTGAFLTAESTRPPRLLVEYAPANFEITRLGLRDAARPARRNLRHLTVANDRPVRMLVTGNRFVPGMRLWLENVPLEEVVVENATEAAATIPAGLAPGHYDLVGEHPEEGSFRYPDAVVISDAAQAPRITTFAPQTFVQSVGGRITIEGEGFFPPLSVRLGSHFLDRIEAAGGRITARVPVGLPEGDYDLFVTNGDGTMTQAPGSVSIRWHRPPGYRFTLEDFEGTTFDDHFKWYTETSHEGPDYGQIELDRETGANGSHQSLKVTVTGGNQGGNFYVYYHINRDDKTKIIEGARGCNRMRFFIKLPTGFKTYDNYNIHVGTYMKDPAERSAEGRHFYHHLNIEGDDRWHEVILTPLVDHERDQLDWIPGVLRGYFDTFSKFYFNGIKYQEDLPRPFSIWIDEIEFYYEPEVIRVTAPQEAVSAAPGEGVHFPVTIHNLDEEVLPIEVTLSPYRFLRDARTGAIVYEVHYDWFPRLYLDENHDGRLQSTETTEVTRYRLSPGETLHAVVVDHVPADIPPGTRHETSLIVKAPGTTQVAGAQLFTRITEPPESGGETASEEERGGEGGAFSASSTDEEGEETAGTTGEGGLPDPEGSSSVTLTITGAIDTTLDEKYPDLDRSARTDASISAKGGERKHVLLRFPIFTGEGGPLPEDAEIESARLELSFYGVGSQIPGSGGTIRVHSLRRAFDAAGGATWNVAEAGVAWQRPGALGEELDYDPHPLDEIVIPDGTGTYPLDVTPAIEAWSEETGENPGFLLLPGPDARIHPYHGGGFLFTAENAGDPHYARFVPRLVVTYRPSSEGGGTSDSEETSRCALETIRLDDAQDTTLDEKYPDYSHGTRVSGFVSGFPGEAKHYLIRFPIFAGEGGPLPEGAEIESARLELSFYGVGSRIPGSGGTIEAYRLLKGWRAGNAPDGSGENAEGEATWRFAEFPAIPWDLPGAQGAGSDYDPTLLDAAVISDGTGTYTLDITPALREWAQGRAPNHGVILFPADGAQNDPYHGGGFLFTAENAGDPDYARFTPTLTIEYRDCP